MSTGNFSTIGDVLVVGSAQGRDWIAGEDDQPHRAYDVEYPYFGPPEMVNAAVAAGAVTQAFLPVILIR